MNGKVGGHSSCHYTEIPSEVPLKNVMNKDQASSGKSLNARDTDPLMDNEEGNRISPAGSSRDNRVVYVDVCETAVCNFQDISQTQPSTSAQSLPTYVSSAVVVQPIQQCLNETPTAYYDSEDEELSFHPKSPFSPRAVQLLEKSKSR